MLGSLIWVGGVRCALTLPCENVYLSPVFSLSTSPFLLLHMLSHVQNPSGPIPPLALFPKRIVQWLVVQGDGGMWDRVGPHVIFDLVFGSVFRSTWYYHPLASVLFPTPSLLTCLFQHLLSVLHHLPVCFPSSNTGLIHLTGCHFLPYYFGSWVHAISPPRDGVLGQGRGSCGCLIGCIEQNQPITHLAPSSLHYSPCCK